MYIFPIAPTSPYKHIVCYPLRAYTRVPKPPRAEYAPWEQAHAVEIFAILGFVTLNLDWSVIVYKQCQPCTWPAL